MIKIQAFDRFFKSKFNALLYFVIVTFNEVSNFSFLKKIFSQYFSQSLGSPRKQKYLGFKIWALKNWSIHSKI